MAVAAIIESAPASLLFLYLSNASLYCALGVNDCEQRIKSGSTYKE